MFQTKEFREFEFLKFEFVSDFDIRISKFSTPNPVWFWLGQFRYNSLSFDGVLFAVLESAV